MLHHEGRRRASLAGLAAATGARGAPQGPACDLTGRPVCYGVMSAMASLPSGRRVCSAECCSTSRLGAATANLDVTCKPACSLGQARLFASRCLFSKPMGRPSAFSAPLPLCRHDQWHHQCLRAHKTSCWQRAQRWGFFTGVSCASGSDPSSDQASPGGHAGRARGAWPIQHSAHCPPVERA